MKEITLAVDEYEAVGNESRRMNEKVKKMHEEISVYLKTYIVDYSVKRERKDSWGSSKWRHDKKEIEIWRVVQEK